MGVPAHGQSVLREDETDIEASDSMFDSLLSVTPDLKYVPDLATNIPTVENGGVVINGSGMDVTWTLRPG
jgi:peptide/nickel transport system substrate-binding protein